VHCLPLTGCEEPQKVWMPTPVRCPQAAENGTWQQTVRMQSFDGAGNCHVARNNDIKLLAPQ